MIDCEAGLEHLSRRTTQNVDLMIVVLDETMKSIKTAVNLMKIASEIDAEVREMIFVANKITTEEAKKKVLLSARRFGIEIAAFIPYDPLVAEYDIKGEPVVKLPEDAPSVRAVRELVKRVI